MLLIMKPHPEQDHILKMLRLKELPVYFTTDEVAYILDITKQGVSWLRKHKGLPSIRPSYHIVRIPAKRFIRWLKQREL